MDPASLTDDKLNAKPPAKGNVGKPKPKKAKSNNGKPGMTDEAGPSKLAKHGK